MPIGLMAAPATNRLRLGRSARIKQRRDFQRLREEGRRLSEGCLVANWRVLAQGGTSRLGVITSARIGNAVVRSRARRLLREAFRLHQKQLQAIELVLVARPSIAGKGLAEVQNDFLATMRRGGMLK